MRRMAFLRSAAMVATFLMLANSLVPQSARADGGVQPRELLDPASAAAPKQISPNGDTGDKLTATFEGGALVAAFAPGNSPYPGFVLKPADGKPWDLSLYGHVEMKVTNLGAQRELVNLRVDNASTPENRNPWNAEMVRIDPGASAVLRVYFGYSYYFQKGYPLDPSAVVRLIFFLGKLDHEAKFRIEDVKAAGWSGEKPGENPDLARLKPAGGWVFGGDGPTADKAAQGDAKARPTAGGVVVDLAPKGTALVKPLRGFWDFSEHMQVRLRVRNTGAAAVSPSFSLTSIDGATEPVRATIPAGGEADVVLPFAARVAWTAPTDPVQENPVKGGAWDRIPGTGTAYRSQKTRGLAVTADAAAATALVIASFRAENPPAKRPPWLGQRPPVPGKWKQTLKQEFDGAGLDPTLFSVYWFHWWDKRQHNSKDNVFLRDGKLVLRTERKKGFKNDDPKGGEFPGEPRDRGSETDYATGWVDTFGKWTQRYGYFEFRCKLPTAPCLWPGIWTMPDRGLARNPKGLPVLDWQQFKNRTDTFSGGMEIDIVEAQSSWGPHRFNTALHFDGYGKETKKIGTSALYVPTDPDGFITVGMLWLPGSLSFYGNGELFWKWESPRVADEPMYLQFQNQLGGWDNDALDDSQLPADFEIDYIRVWQREDLASDDDGPKPNAGGLDGRVGKGLPGPAKEDPRDERLRETRKLLEHK